MKRWIIRLVLLSACVALGFWIWWRFFPGPERLIRRRLHDLAETASCSPKATPVAIVINSQKLGDFFTDDVQIAVDVPGHSSQTFTGRDDLMKAAAWAWNTTGGLQVEFLGVSVAIAPDRQSATADLTAQGRAASEADPFVQELKFTFAKTGDGWLIQKVETVKTLR